MKKLFIGLFLIIALLGISVSGYLFAKPKVVFKNMTDREIEEFELKLPSSRIVIGPIAPGAEEVVYFSFQETSGEASYIINDGQLVSNTDKFYFDSKGQYFRKLTFTFQSDGNVKIDIRE